MVCLPCFLLPAMMFIYIKFICPYVYRIIPQNWIAFFDAILYPTCPVKIPENEDKQKDIQEESCCAGGEEKVESKKDQ